MTPPEIMVIDDELLIRRLLDITLRTHAYAVRQAGTARDGLLGTASRSPDPIILDLGLPGEDGHQTLCKLREWCSKPVIVLSVRNNESDIVKALDNGANDYLVKPFRTGELLARIRSSLRGSEGEINTLLVSCGGLEVDFFGRTARKNKESLKLTVTQFFLLSLLARHQGKVLTHQHLLREVWGDEYQGQLQYLRVFIAQLRKKVEDDPNRPVILLTESGVGYRFAVSET
jgi:two-component system KDP operon response regulator KdpE